jgi:hypothetical protein
VNEAPRPRARGGVERMPGPEHVHAPECGLVDPLHPDQRRGVDDELGSRRRLLPRARLRQVSGDDSQRGLRMHVHAGHLCAGVAIPLREPRSDQPERTRDEHLPGLRESLVHRHRGERYRLRFSRSERLTTFG